VGTITVRVTPRAARPGLDREADGGLRVRVRSAPEQGKANEETTEIVARALGVAKSAVRVQRGARSRTKILAIEGLDDRALKGRLQAL